MTLSKEACTEFWNNLPEDLKHVDILINNAGLAKGLAEIHEGDTDHWDQMIDTNVKGLLYLTRLVSPQMVERRSGHIVNVGSIAGKETYPKGNVYNASKFAVEALTRAIRMDLYKYNIRVSSVSPGAVEETEFAIVRFDGDADKAKIYDDYKPLNSSDIAAMIYSYQPTGTCQHSRYFSYIYPTRQRNAYRSKWAEIDARQLALDIRFLRPDDKVR